MLYKKKWTLKHFGKIKENKVGAQIGISPEISQILKNRDIITEKDAEIFMNPSLDYCLSAQTQFRWCGARCWRM